MPKVIVYSKPQCPYCDMAKSYLNSRSIAFQEIRVDLDAAKLEEMLTKSQRRTVPQIFINDQHVGGYDDLMAAAKSGKLDQLLNSSSS